MAKLIDGGERTDFGTGAVREPATGKGRCDLLQLNEIGEYYSLIEENETLESIFTDLGKFIYSHNTDYLYSVLTSFSIYIEKSIEELWMMDALQMEDGANKYAARNWENGIPTSRYIDSAVRHLLKYIQYKNTGGKKWDDEPHDRAFVWNIMCAAWNINHRPDLIDLPINNFEEFNKSI